MAKYKFAYAANIKEGLYFATIINKNDPHWLNSYILLPFGRETEIVLDRLEFTYMGWA